MDNFDEQLRVRMERLEESLPVGESGAPVARRRPMRLSLGTAIGIAAATLLAGVVAGATVVSNGVQGHPGLFSPGGVFACTQIQQMSPQQAGVALGELGYDITWQIENRDDGSYSQSSQAPADGYIIEGVLDGSRLLLVVERGQSATPGRGSC
jgi:hypothetical protein